VIDRDRVLAKLDELDGYLGELRSIVPDSLEEYLKVEKRRACDLFEKLAVRGVVSRPMADTLRRMKGLRNVLVHEYARVSDALSCSRRSGRASTTSPRSSTRCSRFSGPPDVVRGQELREQTS
jgi:hypothetical protein